MAARPLVASRLSSLRDSAGAALRGRVELNLYFGEARIEGYNISSAALADDASVDVATRAAPHTVVGVHIFGDDACELVHFGTTLVQAQKTLAEVLQVCYAAVTYHELFKLAARDALSTVVADGWRDVYRQINHGDDTTPAHAEEWLAGQGVEAEAVANVCKAMFASGAVLGEVLASLHEIEADPLSAPV